MKIFDFWWEDPRVHLILIGISATFFVYMSASCSLQHNASFLFAFINLNINSNLQLFQSSKQFRKKMKDMNLIESAKETVKDLMQTNDPSQDWCHVERVWKNAVSIAQQEQLLFNEIAQPFN